MKKALFLLIICAFVVAGATGCGKNYFGRSGDTLSTEDTTDGDGTDLDNPSDPPVVPPHPLFADNLGVPIDPANVEDPTILTDYDGDGIPNNKETVTNQYVADYPRVVARIMPPIMMEIRVSSTSTSDNFTETVNDSNVKETIKNSMESKQYNQINEKTTPVVTKESASDSNSNSSSKGHSESRKISAGGSGWGFSANASVSTSSSDNYSIATSMAKSSSSERTSFDNINYIDNLDRNGVEFTSDTVQNITKNCRTSSTLKRTDLIGPNAGVVKATLFLKNPSINTPVHVSNVVCTLSFRTPAGEYLPVKTFRLRNEDYSEFTADIYGGDESGPYVIEVEGLNTADVKKALSNGYVPQIHVVSNDMTRVKDSNYNPGVDNLKIIEERAKARTATIKITGKNVREIYRVAAYDIDEQGRVVPGVSLKKALYNITKGNLPSESWTTDKLGRNLTIADNQLRWHQGSADPDNHPYNSAGNVTGNKWNDFETYVKVYKDENNQTRYLETVKRLWDLQKYNPFDPNDNPSYNPNELITDSELYKMKYWVILHNGKYFNGDINDPIWVGERYEILCFDVDDFNMHYTDYYYTPFQSYESFLTSTLWNAQSNVNEFSRANYLGKVVERDVVHLEVDLRESRFLFGNPNESVVPTPITGGYQWRNFDYSFNPQASMPNGIPKDFNHYVKGGVNGIEVAIEYSDLAWDYEITVNRLAVTGNDLDPTFSKLIKISSDKLVSDAGRVFIDRNTLDATGNPVGYIEGGRRYRATVRAHGQAYKVDVYTPSKMNSYEASTQTVSNPPENALPSGFSYSVNSHTNTLEITIGEASFAEFYQVKVTGPLNGIYSAANSVRTYFCHRGVNKISLNNPSGEISDPGVYTVEAYSVNSNCIDGGGNIIAANTGKAYEGMIYTTVGYEKFASQKQYEAKISEQLFGPEAVDLEVNFNDGSGWFRLALNTNDTGDKLIDCRLTNYYEKDKQRFHIFFEAPAGTRGHHPSSYDIFTGGREVADVFVRTVAEGRYRNNIWLKRESVGSLTTTGAASDGEFINSWMMSADTDATKFLTTWGSRTAIGTNATLGNFSLADTLVDDFFFSPLEQRSYSVKASINDQFVQKDITLLDPPTFNATDGARSISITDINSTKGTVFEVFWRPGAFDPNTLENENLYAYPWQTSGAQEFVMPSNYTIQNLAAYQPYVVAVVAKNSYGTSKPNFYKVGDTITALIPKGTVPVSAPTFSTSLVGGTSTDVLISNLYVPGEFRYQIDFKKETDPDTSWALIKDTFDPNTMTVGQINLFPQSFVLNTGFTPWTKYHLRSSAVDWYGTEGPETDTMLIKTAPPHLTYLDFSIGSMDQITTTNTVWNSSGYLTQVTVPTFTAPYSANAINTVQFEYSVYAEVPGITCPGSSPSGSCNRPLSQFTRLTTVTSSQYGTPPASVVLNIPSGVITRNHTCTNTMYHVGGNLVTAASNVHLRVRCTKIILRSQYSDDSTDTLVLDGPYTD